MIDTPDPFGLARFYRDLLDGEIVAQSATSCDVRIPSGMTLAFQLAPDLRRPTWPDPEVPIQMHLDFLVDDYEEAQDRALRLGAILLEDETRHSWYRVYADPTGHVFCLCLRDRS